MDFRPPRVLAVGSFGSRSLAGAYLALYRCWREESGGGLDGCGCVLAPCAEDEVASLPRLAKVGLSGSAERVKGPRLLFRPRYPTSMESGVSSIAAHKQ